MAELAASVGQQLIHVDYDNNKPDSSSSIRRIHLEPGGDPGCLLDLHLAAECPPPPVRLSDAGLDAPMSAGDDPTQLPVMSCDATSNTPCAHCGLHHHHHHHHMHQLPQPLVYGQLCVDGSLSDDRYPAGLRTPQL